jgi:hypothetical protein
MQPETFSDTCLSPTTKTSRNNMPRRQTNYKPILVRVMSFLDDEEYNECENFTQEQLGGLTPNKLMLWFNDVTFGVSEPPTGHDINPLS